VILVIDNYDSFTFNLVQLLGMLTSNIEVRRNDAIDCDGIRTLRPRGILISPGPGRPEDAGVTVEAIRTFGPSVPILGVCLGHQAIGLAYGGSVVHAPSLVHGKTSLIVHQGSPLFRDLPNPFRATRYHSLVIAEENFPSDLDITARTQDGVIMGVCHRRYPTEGVQFHPESILTEGGERMLRNWLTVLA